MEPLSKISTLPTEEVLLELKAALPLDWLFDLKQIGGFWCASFIDDQGKVLWAEESTAYNIGIYSAYGWLWLRLNHQPRATAWASKMRSPTLTSRWSSVKTPDPEDLDPNEIAVVYGGLSSPNDRS